MIYLQILRCAGGFHWECRKVEYLMEMDQRMITRRAEISVVGNKSRISC